MDATTDDKALYVWIQGDPYQSPEVHVMVAPTMDLAEFRDQHVDTSRGYLIVRVGQVCDQPLSVNQDCNGQRYNVTLVPVEATATPETKVASAVPTQHISGISLTAIKGIGRHYATNLHVKANINSVQELLAAGATPYGRGQLQSQTRLSPRIILRWVQLADLMRIEGIGSDYSQLLWNAGITCVPDLAVQKPKLLLNTLTRVKEEQGGVQRLPYLEQVSDWIRQASALKPAVAL